MFYFSQETFQKEEHSNAEDREMSYQHGRRVSHKCRQEEEKGREKSLIQIYRRNANSRKTDEHKTPQKEEQRKALSFLKKKAI